VGICKNGANIKCAYSEIGGTGIKLNITTEKKKGIEGKDCDSDG